MTSITHSKISKMMTLGIFVFSGMTSASAATIAIIDSGTDLKHKDLAQSVWVNPLEIAGNAYDDDQNGYIDDLHGWNFAENNYMVIDYSYLGTFSQDPYRYFELQLKQFKGTATAEDKAWMDEKRKDAAFIKEMGIFGNFVHGTHVAAIAAGGDPEAKIMPLKLIPTEVKLPFMASLEREMKKRNIKSMEDEKFTSKIRDLLVRLGLDYLAKTQSSLLVTISGYVNTQQAQIANCSFGTAYDQIEPLLRELLKIVFRKNLTDETVKKYSIYFLEKLVEHQKAFATTSPHTLFVIAAGNSASNNDEIPAAPANINQPNSITVAATYGTEKLASFSSYGAKTVDIAAPGVGIESAIPGDERLTVSGTSQAAPFVARVAGKIMDSNPNLRPFQVKKILMGTVDHKGFLQDKVAAGGVANESRAVEAAVLSKTMALEEAISEARGRVADVEIPVSIRASQMGSRSEGAVLPLMNLFK